jgi:hypothetical protein
MTLSDGAIDAGSFEQVLRRRRNCATRLDSMSAAVEAVASMPSPGFSPDEDGGGGNSLGSPSITWYFTVRSGSGGV